MQKSFLTLSAVLLLAGCQPSQQATDSATVPAPEKTEQFLLTSKTPYQPQQDWQSYSRVPAGFSIVGLQHVARHGSRFLSSRGDDDLMLQLLLLATEQQGLTPLGQELALLVRQLHQAHQPDKYGEISGLGVQEHQQIAARMLARLPTLFQLALEQQQRMAVLHSGRERADQSGDAFVAGLTAIKPQLASLFDAGQADEATLYFYKAEGSEAFQHYRKSDPRLARVMQQLEADPKRLQAATAMLQRFFTGSFFARLAHGEIELTIPDDDDAIRNPLDAANVLYSLYSIASNLTAEGEFDFSSLLLPEHLLPLAELDDADSFYGRGPAFANDNVTFNLAGRLVKDMLDKAGQSSGYAATFRFTHAQVMMPLAAYLGILDASEPLPESEIYSYQNSRWRSGKVAPMAANVQWEIFRNAGNETIVRMLHNERETRFAANCQLYADTRYFYLLTELQSCLNH